jgi:GNAT superfamily N-acetyltransferase
MGLSYRALRGADLRSAVDDLAALRIEVFRDWPYLYDGDPDYERSYIKPYLQSSQALVVGAYDGPDLVGAATGTPLSDHAADFGAGFETASIEIAKTFYCAESVLRAPHRGQGAGHVFFDMREAHARALGFAYCCFCAVIRPEDHPARPPTHRPLDPFWRARGYRPLTGVIAHFSWKDVGAGQETRKPLQFWIRSL